MIEVWKPHSLHNKRLDQKTYEAWLRWPLTEGTCSDCFRELSIDCFWPKTRWPCGLARTWSTYCKDCVRERTRFYARQRRRRQGIPERNGQPYRIKSGWHESGYGDKVPIEPFAEWLSTARVRFGDGAIGSGLSQLAELAHIDVEYLRRISNLSIEQSNVTLGLVDRVLVASESSTQIHDLYPGH